MKNESEENLLPKTDTNVINKIQNINGSKNCTTPTQSKCLAIYTKDEFSPMFSQYSLEDQEEIDVMWDWHSPQSKHRTRRLKRSHPENSPKIPIKRQPSNNQFSVLDKITEEIKLIRDHIIETTDINSHLKKQAEQAKITNIEDIFNDSMEDELYVCSQKIETDLAVLNAPDHPMGCNSVNQLQCQSSLNAVKGRNNNIIATNSNLNENREIKIADDSFDVALGTLNDEDLEFSNKTLEDKNKKMENTDLGNLAKHTLDEIDRKRRQALEKRQTKKQPPLPPESDSPIKCSPEEIEKKRLKALAKLEAKKKQDIIERNRLAALKRLESNKKRRALQFDTTTFRS